MAYQLRWLRKNLLPIPQANGPEVVHEAAASNAAPVRLEAFETAALGVPTAQVHSPFNPIESLENKARAAIFMEYRLHYAWLVGKWSDLLVAMPSHVHLGHNTSLNLSIDGPEGDSIRSKGRLSIHALGPFQDDPSLLAPLRAGGLSHASSNATSRHTSMKSFKRHKSQRQSISGAGGRASMAAREEGERLRLEEQLMILEEEDAGRDGMMRSQLISFSQMAKLDFYNPTYDDHLVEKPLEQYVLEHGIPSAPVDNAAETLLMSFDGHSISTWNQITERQRQITIASRALCICWVEEFEERKSIYLAQKAEWADAMASLSPFSSYYSRRAGQYESSVRMLAAADQLATELAMIHAATVEHLIRDRTIAHQRLCSRRVAELLLHMARWHPLTVKRERLERARVVATFHPFLLPFNGPYRLADLVVWWGMWLRRGQAALKRKQQRTLVSAMAGHAANTLAKRQWTKWLVAVREGRLLRRLGVQRMVAEDRLRLVYWDKFRLLVEKHRRRIHQSTVVNVWATNASTELLSVYYRKWRGHHRSAPNMARLAIMTNACHDLVRRRYFEKLTRYLTKRRLLKIAAKAAGELRILNLALKNHNVLRKRYYAIWCSWVAPRAAANGIRRAAIAAEEEAVLLVEVKQEMDADRMKVLADIERERSM